MNCAVHIGFYYRKEVIINFQTYYNLPIARYLCRKKGTQKHSHKTFSLLPSLLVPYHKHDLSLMVRILSDIHQKNLSLTETISSLMGKDESIDLESHQIHKFEDIFSQAIAKITSIPQLKPLLPVDLKNPVPAMLDFIDSYQPTLAALDPAIPVERLSLDFFFSCQPQDYFSRHFLFGTPSQKRHLSG